MSAAKKGGLGRGLEALFADVPVKEPAVETAAERPVKSDEKNDGDAVKYIKIHDIMPNVNQPRKTFDEEKIEELANSIKEHGIIQPIVVRKHKNGYEIVAGERRWRAAMKAELAVVPCLIRELNDEQNMLIAIIENMQREDLNPIEEAGHGRTLITIPDEKKQEEIWEKIIDEGLSVRETEKLAASEGKTKKRTPLKKKKSPDVLKVEEELKTALGTKISISGTQNTGKIEIEFYSKDDLERLIELLKSLG